MLMDASEVVDRAGASAQAGAKSWRRSEKSCCSRDYWRSGKGQSSAGGGACDTNPLTGRSVAGTRSTVMCIDNDNTRAGALATALSKLGYAVELAHDGPESLAMILANQPELVVYEFSTCQAQERKTRLRLLEQFSQAGRSDSESPFISLPHKTDRESGLHEGHSRKNDRISTPDWRDSLDGVVERAKRFSEPTPKTLTAREKDVLTWVARGKTSAEIAIILGLSERTINFHCDNAMKRLDVVNRTQAVATAVAGGLIGI